MVEVMEPPDDPNKPPQRSFAEEAIAAFASLAPNAQSISLVNENATIANMKDGRCGNCRHWRTLPMPPMADMFGNAYLRPMYGYGRCKKKEIQNWKARDTHISTYCNYTENGGEPVFGFEPIEGAAPFNQHVYDPNTSNNFGMLHHD